MKPADKNNKPVKPAGKPLADGRWFALNKDSFNEARLIEVIVKNGSVVEQSESVDLSRIQLGKLVRRIGETFGESVVKEEKANVG